MLIYLADYLPLLELTMAVSPSENEVILLMRSELSLQLLLLVNLSQHLGYLLLLLLQVRVLLSSRFYVLL